MVTHYHYVIVFHVIFIIISVLLYILHCMFLGLAQNTTCYVMLLLVFYCVFHYRCLVFEVT